MSTGVPDASRGDDRPSPRHQFHQETHVEAGGKAFVVQHGDLSVYQWKPEYRIQEYDSAVYNGDPVALRAQPSRMLRAQYQIVPFDAERRREEVTKLSAWRDRGEEASALLLHGPGGQGKTRLANHIAESARAAGWQVLQAVSNRAGMPGEELTKAEVITSEKAGILLVVDYAERWPLTTLLSLMQDSIFSRGQRPLRILLIARSARTWWQSVSYKIENELHMHASRIGLSALAQQPQDWPLILKAARDAFLAAYNLPQPITVDIPDLAANENYQLVLAAHMAALALVDAAVRNEPAPVGNAAVTEYLLARERTSWIDFHEADPIHFSTDPTVMAHTVFTATLTRPLPFEEGVTVLQRVGAVEVGQRVGPVLGDHALCYPPVDPATVLEPLYPDRLGEDFIALSIPAQDISALDHHHIPEMSDAWAARSISRLFSIPGNKLPTWLSSATSVLIETSRRWPHVAQGHLYPLVRERPEVILGAGGSALASFSDLPSVPMEILEDIERLLPEGRSNDLAVGRAVLVERLSNYWLERTDNLAERAVIYTKLAEALQDAAIHDKQLIATGEAVKCYQVLVRSDPQGFVIPLAIALDAHGTAQMMNRNVDAAVQFHGEAAAVYQFLYSNQPADFANEFARTLTNLGNSLLRKHRVGDALRAQQEAVRIRKSANTLSKPSPDDVGMAWALVQLGITLSLHGRRVEALGLLDEAIVIYRNSLASGEVGLEIGTVAHAVEIKGRILVMMGRFDEAEQPLRESITMLQPLMEANRSPHRSLLSQALAQLGICLLNLAQAAEGIDALQEAVELYREDLFGPRIEPNFVATLSNLGGALTASGSAGEALSILREAVDLSRRLMEQDPHEQGLLPLALLNYSAALMSLKKWEDALPIAQESEVLYRELTTADPEAYAEPWQKARGAVADILAALE